MVIYLGVEGLDGKPEHMSKTSNKTIISFRGFDRSVYDSLKFVQRRENVRKWKVIICGNTGTKTLAVSLTLQSTK
jgi:c-di-GMP-binding flagellar brake protein YcgR